MAGGSLAGGSLAGATVSGPEAGATGADPSTGWDLALPSVEVVEVACPKDPYTASPPCLGACGNGVVDSCLIPCDQSNPMCQLVSEVCDGAPPNESCVSRGFAGGTLHCGQWCGPDVSDCLACVDHPQITSCEEHFLDVGDPYGLTLASDGQQSALFFASQMAFHFARVDASLELLSDARCFRFADTDQFGTPLAVARTPTGWLLAMEPYRLSGPNPGSVQPGTILVAVDDMGQLKPDATFFADAMRTKLIGRVDGGPLMLSYPTDADYVNGARGADARLLDEDGRVLSNTHIPEIDGGDSTGVYTGNGFLVATAGIATVKLGPNGDIESSQTIAPTIAIPSLAWNGTEGRLTWLERPDPDGEAQVHWARVDEDGKLLADPIVVATGNYYGAVPVAAGPFGTIAILPGQSGQGGFALGVEAIGIGDDGQVTLPPFALTQTPERLGSVQLQPLGAGAIAAWAMQGTPMRIGLVGLKPD
jgi:hypothetical protein